MADPFYIPPGISVYSAYEKTWPVALVNLDDSPHQWDREDGGLYRIYGVVDRTGSPGSYRWRLFDRVSGRMIRELWTDSDGSYSFDNIAYRYQGYTMVLHDHSDTPCNATIFDRVTPVAMS